MRDQVAGSGTTRREFNRVEVKINVASFCPWPREQFELEISCFYRMNLLENSPNPRTLASMQALYALSKLHWRKPVVSAAQAIRGMFYVLSKLLVLSNRWPAR